MKVYFCVLILTSALCGSIGCSGRSAGVAESSARAVTSFGDEISLESYAIRPRDGHTEIELTWTAQKSPAADYYAFVHAIDASGSILFQLDHPLKNETGQLTSRWIPDTPVQDRFFATPPAAHAPGAYTLRVGLYVPQPMRVLQITRAGFPQPKDAWNDHAIVIENVDCR